MIYLKVSNNDKEKMVKMERKIPEYYKYLSWYDLNNPLDLYNFVQEMVSDGVELNDYPDIKVYYTTLYNNAFKSDPNMVTVDYVIKKLRNALIRYNFAHTTSLVDGNYYYYWWSGK